MKDFLKDIPFEVQEVWIYKHLKRPIGSEMYKRFEEVMNKYPEHFPQETIYKTIPQEVHDKYQEELNVLYKSFYPPKESDIREGEGMVAYLQRVQENPIVVGKELVKKDLIKAADYVFNVAPKIRRDYEEAKKKLWNKHYKRYKLKYEE